MSKRIIYKDETGVVCVLIPSPEALLNYTIEQIATKDVPAGLAYKIVDVTDIPADRTFRGAWQVNEADLTDGVGGEHNMFITDSQHPDYVEQTND